MLDASCAPLKRWAGRKHVPRMPTSRLSWNAPGCSSAPPGTPAADSAKPTRSIASEAAAPAAGPHAAMCSSASLDAPKQASHVTAVRQRCQRRCRAGRRAPRGYVQQRIPARAKTSTSCHCGSPATSPATLPRRPPGPTQLCAAAPPCTRQKKHLRSPRRAGSAWLLMPYTLNPHATSDPQMQ